MVPAVLAGVALGYVAWRLFDHAVSHRYRHLSDGRSSLAGRASAVWRWCGSTHPSGLNLPFTYPHWRPSCSAHSPGCRCRLPARRDHGANLVLLIASTFVLTGLDAPTSRLVCPRRLGYAGCGWPLLIVAQQRWLEPISSNFAFGRINVVLMTW